MAENRKEAAPAIQAGRLLVPQVTRPVSQQDEPAGMAGEEEPLTTTKAGPAQSGAATCDREDGGAAGAEGHGSLVGAGAVGEA